MMRLPTLIVLSCLTGWLAVGASGCGAEVEAGQVVTRDVWFDTQGRAHCPVDAAPPDRWVSRGGDLATPSAEELERSVVEPFKTVCPNGHPVRWVTEDVPCWRCDGAGACPECGGSGTDPITHKACPTCVIEDATGRRRGSGACHVCGGSGFVLYGPYSTPPAASSN